MTAPGTRAAVERRVASPAELEVRGLSKRFGGIPVLSDVSLTVGKAEAVALIGANGAGKSTLRSCLRLVEPDAGQVRLLSGNLWIRTQKFLQSVSKYWLRDIEFLEEVVRYVLVRFQNGLQNMTGFNSLLMPAHSNFS